MRGGAGPPALTATAFTCRSSKATVTHPAAIDKNVAGGHVRRRVRSQEDDHTGHFLRCGEPADRRPAGDVVFVEVATAHVLRQQLGRDIPRTDGHAAYAARGPLDAEDLG